MPCDNHHVKSFQFFLVMAKTLPYQAFEPIAVDRSMGSLAGYGKAKSGDREIVRCCNCQKLALAQTAAPRENSSVLVRIDESGALGEAHTARHPVYGESRARPLARRALSTLRPPRVDMRTRKPWSRLRLMLLG